MSGFSEVNEIIPGLLVGCVNDVEWMVQRRADVLVPLEYLDGSVWNTGFRGEILYYPIDKSGVLPDDLLRSLVDAICLRLDEGKKVGMFCASGHGRTGYVAACVLARRGIKNPIGYLRRDYSPKAIETDKQVNEVYAYARSLRAEQINAQGLGEHFFEYRSYRGADPYLYLTFSEWDDDTAPETVRILNELGFRVAYDRSILEGRLWSGSRSDAIENCSLFVMISTPCECNSHIRYADYNFAELLEKPMVFIELDHKNPDCFSDDSKYIVGSLSDSDFADKCLKTLTENGMSADPAKDDAAGESAGRPVLRKRFRPKRQWDLAVTYYENYGDSGRTFSRDRQRDCNLRTRETFDSRHNLLDKPSDEELYRAIGWKLVRFDLYKRSDRFDYFPDDDDKAFMRRLCTLGGKPVPEISREYKAAQKRIDDFWRDYPYMDEFEYVDSKFDD